MSNSFFKFKQFTIHQDHCAMKVTTDNCLFGAWTAQQLLESFKPDSSILDIGTGTGLLPLMIAQKNRATTIDAIEIDPKASTQANENIVLSPWANRIQLFNDDATTFTFQKKYDAIVSNPPFYENELKGKNTERNTAHHNEGLLINDLIHIITKNLKSNGSFFLLLPYKRYAEIKELIKNEGLYLIKVLFVRQSDNHSFFRVLLEGTNINTNEYSESEISITNDKKEYTSDFVALLENYYLYL